MIAKVAFQKIRRLAKRGSNEMLQRAIQEVYAAGIEYGMRKLSEELKGRLNDNQISNNGDDSSGERRKPDSSESGECARPTSTDADRDQGSPTAE